MKKIVTLGGSNSKNSINKKLVLYAGNQIGIEEIIHIDLNDFEMPIFSIDVENEHGFPRGAVDLNEVIKSADGFIISLAEHNGAYSAVFKNAFDWLSRIEGKVWRNKPMLLMATSPGARGGQSVLNIALNRFPYNGGNIVGSMAFPSFNENFKEGVISNVLLKEKLLDLITKFKNEL